jgi:hypothetical protein
MAVAEWSNRQMSKARLGHRYELPDEGEIHIAHPELHHYTGWAGLEGIWQSQTLWATSFTHLNDRTELEIAKRYLNKALADDGIRIIGDLLFQHPELGDIIQGRRIGEVAKSECQRFVDALWVGTFGGPNIDVPMVTPFITSLCSHAADQEYERNHGLLSQWRGYGQDEGYCLVFDTQALADLVWKEWEMHAYPMGLYMIDVKYAVDGFSIEDVLPKISGFLQNSFEQALNGDMGGVTEMLRPMIIGSTRVKHRGFQEEREVRVVALPDSETLHQRGLERYRKWKQRPVKKIETAPNGRPFVSLFAGCGDLPIKRVIVRPGIEQNKWFEKAKRLVDGRVQVTKSETPLR